jgi:hypothetical protein
MTHCSPGSTVTVSHPVGHRLIYVRRVLSVAREQSTGPLAADRQPEGHAAAKYWRSVTPSVVRSHKTERVADATLERSNAVMAARVEADT